MAYESVNGQWPPGSNDGRGIKPTPQEAISATRRLYRLAMGRRFAGKIELTSGNRYSYARNGVFHINPDHGGNGWHALIHDLSHYCHRRLNPGHKPHDGRGTHAAIEREMIRHVVESGWLNGALSRPSRPKLNVQQERHARILRRIAAWEAKARRAKNALRKLARQRAYYERTLPK